MFNRLRRLVNYTVPVRLRAARFRILVWGGMELRGITETANTKVIAHYANLRPGAVLDVGANLGQTLLNVCATHATQPYFGFEPNPACVAYLNQIIAINRLQGCTIVPVGLSEKAGLLRLHVAPGDVDPAGTLIPTLRPNQPRAVQWVPVFPLDEIVSKIRAEPVSFVKIDVEGSELEVLCGMKGVLSRNRPPILCEVLPRTGGASPGQSEVRRAAILEIVKELGYRVHHVQKASEGRLHVPVDTFHPGPFDRTASWDYLFLPL